MAAKVCLGLERRGWRESYASYGKTSTETLVTLSTKPQPAQGFPASMQTTSYPTPHAPSCQAAAEFSSHAPWGCCLCFWPGQEGTCANGLLSVNACSELLQGTALTLAAVAWHPVPAEGLIPAGVGEVPQGESALPVAGCAVWSSICPCTGGLLKMLNLMLHGGTGPEMPRKPPTLSCFKCEAWKYGVCSKSWHLVHN